MGQLPSFHIASKWKTLLNRKMSSRVFEPILPCFSPSNDFSMLKSRSGCTDVGRIPEQRLVAWSETASWSFLSAVDAELLTEISHLTPDILFPMSEVFVCGFSKNCIPT